VLTIPLQVLSLLSETFLRDLISVAIKFGLTGKIGSFFMMKLIQLAILATLGVRNLEFLFHLISLLSTKRVLLLAPSGKTESIFTIWETLVQAVTSLLSGIMLDCYSRINKLF